jgi:ATP-binding cassette subfamily C protein
MTALALPAPAAVPRPVPLGAAFALALLLSLAAQATMLTAPLLTMHVFDGVLESRNLDTLTVLSLAFLAALALGGLLRALRGALIAAVAERLGRRLQMEALTAAVRAAAEGDRGPAAVALQDLAELRRLLSGAVPADLLDLVAIPLALGFLWMLHPAFFAVALCGAALKLAVGGLADRATRDLLAEATAAQGQVTRGLMGWLRNQDLLAGLGLLPAVLRRWAPAHLAALAAGDAALRRARALQSLLTLVIYAQQIAVVVTGAVLLTRDAVSPGVMLAASTMVAFATNPVAHLVAQWRDWGQGAMAYRRLRRLVAGAPEPVPAPPLAGAPPGLSIEGVTLWPPAAIRPLLQDLTLHVPPGQAWAVAGPNGAGKTTLLRAVLGLAAPAAGRVLLDGQDTHRVARGAIGPRLGYLPQEAQLLEGSVLENIGRFAGGAPEAAVAAARRAGAHEAIGRLAQGYDTPAGSGAGLSGGQRRLVALARALHGSPRLLVLDEPEAGLDAPARAALRDAVRAARAAGAVVLLVTHDAAAWQGTIDGVLRLGGAEGWRAEPAETAP